MKFTRVFALSAIVAVGLLCSKTSAQAQNVYHVRAGATGANNGSDWNNAFSSLPGTLVRGATYYIADGTYGGYVFDDPVSGTTVITIKKAIEVDHGSSVGWQSSYGDGQAAFTGGLAFRTSYWVMDGQTGGGPTAWESGYGFQVTETDATTACLQIGVTGGPAANNVSVRHMKLVGMDNDLTGGGGAGNDAISLRSGSGNTLISYVWMHAAGRCPLFMPEHVGSTTIEYSHITRFYGNSGAHAEAASIDTAGGDVTFRYNLIQWASSTGGIQWGDGKDGAPEVPNAKMYVYGNVFYLLSTSTHGNGTTVGTWTSGIMHHVFIYNNTFINIPADIFYPGNGDAVDLNSRNNLFYNSDSPGYSGWAAHDFNHYINSGGSHTEANSTSAVSGDPFMGFVNWDFALKVNTAPADPNIASQYRTDMFGRTGLTRGAIQFASGPDTTPPVISSVQAVSILTNGATITWITGEPSTSVVDFGITTSYGGSVSNAAFVNNHSMAITGLSSSSIYHFRVQSADAAGNRAQSGDGTFTTLVNDTTPPVVSLTSPVAGLTISNTITLAATASDNIGIAGVDFRIDGVTVNTDSSPPYTYDWDSRGVANGLRTITAVARDAIGNKSTNSVSLTVQNSGPTLKDGLVAHWNFDEGSGTGAGDFSGNGHIGALLNGCYWTTGRFAGGLGLDGVNDYVRVANSPLLELTNTITLAAWVKPATNGGWQSVIRKLVQEGTHVYPYTAYDLLLVDFGGTFQVRMSVSGTDGNRVYASGNTALNYGNWYHVVGTYDGTNVGVFVNGAEDGSAPYNGTLLQTGQALYIGRNGAGSDLFKGTLDEVRIYNRVLSLSELQALYSTTAPAQPSGFGFSGGGQ